MSDELRYILLFVASLWAGAQNALAGGGSFVTLSALLLVGLDPRAANITSTVALFPGQVVSGWAGRRFVSGTPALSFRGLVTISLVGGALGAVLLLSTPASFFAKLVPWLVLFATGVFAWGNFARRGPIGGHPGGGQRIGRLAALTMQFLIAVYGGYFGGGIGFLMLAALTMAGLGVRHAGATKNALAGVMNFSALLVFVFSPDVHWVPAAVTCVAAVAGGLGGAYLLRIVPEPVLRAGVIVVGVLLTVGLFVRG